MARPTACRASAAHPLVSGTKSGNWPTDVSPRRRGDEATTYLTPDRLAALEANLDEADWAVLETVQRFGFVSGPQLAQLHFGPGESDGRAARRTLVRLRTVELLDILERRIGGV